MNARAAGSQGHPAPGTAPVQAPRDDLGTAPDELRTAPDDRVRVTRRGSLTTVTLDRPRALNALDLGMVRAIADGVLHAVRSGSDAILLEGAGGRGLSGGGDIKALAAASPAEAEAFLRAEYALDRLLADLPVPVVAIMHGITMGGGIGISGHGPLRVVTEESRLAMPEVRIGILPDVGGHRLLAAAPGHLGEYLALTGNSLSAGDAIACGFADAFVPHAHLPALADSLAAGEDPEAAVRAHAITAPESPLLLQCPWIDESFGAGTVPEVLAHLAAREELEAREALTVIRGVNPTAAAATLSAVRWARERGASLGEVLNQDLWATLLMLARPDFREGVRAVVVDKDGAPRWQPNHAEDVDPGLLAHLANTERPGLSPLSWHPLPAKGEPRGA